MADGVTGVVTLSPEEGERVRGAAAGLGNDVQFDDMRSSKVGVAMVFSFSGWLRVGGFYFSMMKPASRTPTKLLMRSSGVRPNPEGVMVLVSEMPSKASL